MANPATLAYPPLRLRGPALPAIAVVGALGLALASLAVFGDGAKGTRHTLDLTARFSYLWFWLAYAGGALAALFGPSFQPLARSARDFGLAFVAAHSVHVLLVLWLYWISPEPPIALAGAVFFGVGIGFMYLLAILSIKHLAQMLPRWLWRFLLLVGMEYIEYAFLTDFWVNPLHPMTVKQIVAYLPFMLIGLLATGLRLVRWGKAALAA